MVCIVSTFGVREEVNVKLQLPGTGGVYVHAPLLSHFFESGVMKSGVTSPLKTSALWQMARSVATHASAV
jgi:hypothetical protein